MRSWPDVSTGRRTRPSFWTSLQDAVDEIEGGEVSLPLAGIEGALGAYAPLQNMRASVVNARDHGALGQNQDYTDEFQEAYDALPDPSSGVVGGGVIEVPPGRYQLGRITLLKNKPVVIMREGGAARRFGHYSTYGAGDAVLIGLDDGAGSAIFAIDSDTDASENGYGFRWEGLHFDLTGGTEAGIYAENVNAAKVSDCVAYGPQTQTVDQWLVRAIANGGDPRDSSWWRIEDNRTNRLGLAYVGSSGSYNYNNWGFVGNVVFPGTEVDSCIRIVHANRVFSLGNNLEPGAGSSAYGYYLDGVTQSVFLGDSGESPAVGSVFIKAVGCYGNVFMPVGYKVVTDASNKLIEDNGVNVVIAPSATGLASLYGGAESTRITNTSGVPVAGIFPHGIGAAVRASIPSPIPQSRWQMDTPLHDVGGIVSEYWDGSAWQSWSPTDGANLGVDNIAAVSVDDTHKKCRFRLGSTGQPDWPLIVAKFRQGTGAPTGTVAITVEALASNGTTVQQTFTASVPLASTTEGLTYPLPYIDGPYVRVTLDFPLTSGKTVNLSRVACYTAQVGRASGKNVAGRVMKGPGSPESAIYGRVGDLWLRTDGGTSTTLYIKESGDNTNTGWVAK